MASNIEKINLNLEDVMKKLDLRVLLNALSFPPFRNNSNFALLLNYIVSGNYENQQNLIRTCILEDKKEFVMLLLHTGQYEAALIIEPRVIEILDSTRLDPSNNTGDITCPFIYYDLNEDRLIKLANISIKNTNIYPMSKNPRGYCVLINNYLTYGTFKEMNRFRNIFYQLHYNVIMENNLSATDIVKLLMRLSSDTALESHEAFACIILSHGTNNSEILGFDEKPIDIQYLCNIFNDKNCPKLTKKPRTFVFNCCRGDESTINNEPTLGLAMNFETQWKPKLPQIRDFIICYSTLNGYAAYVNWNDGTLFGGVVSRHLIERAWDRDMNSILTRTNNELTEKQPFDWVQSFTSDMFFDPSKPYTIELRCKKSFDLPIETKISIIRANKNDKSIIPVDKKYELKTELNKYSNKFKELCQLGNGGFATVFESKDIIQNSVFAIKKICFTNEDYVKMAKELEFLSTLKSEYVVKYYDSWIEPNYYIGSFNRDNNQNITPGSKLYYQGYINLLHIQMELCPLTLKNAIDIITEDCKIYKKPLSFIGYYISYELMIEILEGVNYLHSCMPEKPAIIHRDLKPENILLTSFVNNRFVRIADFGLSTFHETAKLSHTIGNVGTMNYRAPEVNSCSRYTTKADIYSLGIIMQEMFDIYGQMPNNIAQQSKMKSIGILYKKLLDASPDDRPTCEQILIELGECCLSRSEILQESQFVQILRKQKQNSIKENFIDFFIQNKYEQNNNINTEFINNCSSNNPCPICKLLVR